MNYTGKKIIPRERERERERERSWKGVLGVIKMNKEYEI